MSVAVPSSQLHDLRSRCCFSISKTPFLPTNPTVMIVSGVVNVQYSQNGRLTTALPSPADQSNMLTKNELATNVSGRKMVVIIAKCFHRGCIAGTGNRQCFRVPRKSKVGSCFRPVDKVEDHGDLSL